MKALTVQRFRVCPTLHKNAFVGSVFVKGQYL